MSRDVDESGCRVCPRVGAEPSGCLGAGAGAQGVASRPQGPTEALGPHLPALVSLSSSIWPLQGGRKSKGLQGAYTEGIRVVHLRVA